MHQHLVRFGSLSWIGLFRSSLGQRFAAHASVVCESPRGLEIGEVVSDELFDLDQLSTGTILRLLSESDQLLWRRLENHRHRALAGCESKLRELNIPSTLLDAELTFDGQNLFFYFLGETPAELDHLTSELSEIYQAKIHYRRFAETLRDGCGPDCGTREGNCGTASGCGSCGIHGACRTAGQ